MSENVVSLRDGGAPRIKDTPEPDVIVFCEDLLNRARSGEVVAIATVEVAPNRLIGVGFSNPRQEGQGHLLLSGLFTLMRRLDDQMN